MIKIRCELCGEVYIYTKRTGGAARKYHPACARKARLDDQRKYFEQWRKRNIDKLRVYNRKYQQEYKALLRGFKQMRLDI